MKFLILLLLHWIAFGSTLANRQLSANFIASSTIQINESTGSTALTEISVRSETDCAIRCMTRGCSVASMNEVTRICQLIVLHDASTPPVSPATYVPRVVGGESGDRVWKTPDFDQRLMVARRVSVHWLFSASGNGSNGSVQALTVPETGCYRIEAWGASGGSTNRNYTIYLGGYGAKIAGNFNLTGGTEIFIVVGQKGGDASQMNTEAGSGGGGGSFVYTSAESVLLLAAGGGGGGSAGFRGEHGQSGLNGTDCSPFSSAYGGFGGSNGQPGFTNTTFATSQFHGGPGAGWLGKGSMTRRTSSCGDRGGSRADGWVGGLAGSLNSGATGGFGGGGGGGESRGASGGGGGFSGGGAGLISANSGGGGGSFCGGIGCVGMTGGNTGSDNGSVVMEKIVAGTCL